MFGGLGIAEMGVIAGIALLLFGPRQLPRLAKSVGESIREFRKAGKELIASVEEASKE